MGTLMGLPWIPIAFSVFLVVALLWGIGVGIGGASHYNGLITLVILALAVFTVVRYPDEALLGAVTGLLSHGVIMSAILALQRH